MVKKTLDDNILADAHNYGLILSSREIFLHSCIDHNDEDPGIDYRMANIFLKNIKILEKIDSSKQITVHQYSIGGGWCEGMMIFDAIKTCTAPVRIVTHGIAGSMGSIVPQAASERVTMPSCWWLLHNGTTGISGHLLRQARSWHSWEEAMTEQMLEIYIEKMSESEIFAGKTDKQIKNFITKQMMEKEDWWISAKEAVLYGLADSIYGEEE